LSTVKNGVFFGYSDAAYATVRRSCLRQRGGALVTAAPWLVQAKL